MTKPEITVKVEEIKSALLQLEEQLNSEVPSEIIETSYLLESLSQELRRLSLS